MKLLSISGRRNKIGAPSEMLLTAVGCAFAFYALCAFFAEEPIKALSAFGMAIMFIGLGGMAELNYRGLDISGPLGIVLMVLAVVLQVGNF